MMPKIMIILSEIILGGVIVWVLIRSSVTSDSVFWIAAITEIGIGFLALKTAKRRSIHKGNISWNIFEFGLYVIGIGAPIILSLTIDSLESIGKTWLIFAFTLNSLNFYDYIIKKKPIPFGDIF